jgi:hypothetical protein
MTPFRMTVMAPGGRLGVLFLAFAAIYLYGSYLSAGWAKRRYATVPSRHIARHRRTVTA